LGMGCTVTKDELIAVGRRLSDTGSAGHAARPDDVLHNDLLTEMLAQNRRHEPPAGVEWPARSVRYNHGHRPRWPSLRPR
jgi:hypothetical protein